VRNRKLWVAGRSLLGYDYCREIGRRSELVPRSVESPINSKPLAPCHTQTFLVLMWVLFASQAVLPKVAQRGVLCTLLLTQSGDAPFLQGSATRLIAFAFGPRHVLQCVTSALNSIPVHTFGGQLTLNCESRGTSLCNGARMRLILIYKPRTASTNPMGLII